MSWEEPRRSSGGTSSHFFICFPNFEDGQQVLHVGLLVYASLVIHVLEERFEMLDPIVGTVEVVSLRPCWS